MDQPMEYRNVSNQELVGLEKRYWQAMKDHDLETALSLTDFPCVIASAHGIQSVDRESFKKMFNSHQESVRTLEFTGEPEVRVLGPDTAVIAYKVHTTVETDGKKRTIDAIDTSTWIRRNGAWTCAMHTEIEAAPQKH